MGPIATGTQTIIIIMYIVVVPLLCTDAIQDLISYTKFYLNGGGGGGRFPFSSAIHLGGGKEMM